MTHHNHDKYITAPKFNQLTTKSFTAKSARANLVTKADFDIKLINFNKEITQMK